MIAVRVAVNVDETGGQPGSLGVQNDIRAQIRKIADRRYFVPAHHHLPVLRPVSEPVQYFRVSDEQGHATHYTPLFPGENPQNSVPRQDRDGARKIRPQKRRTGGLQALQRGGRGMSITVLAYLDHREPGADGSQERRPGRILGPVMRDLQYVRAEILFVPADQVALGAEADIAGHKRAHAGEFHLEDQAGVVRLRARPQRAAGRENGYAAVSDPYPVPRP